jgi:hypothetical protein
MVSEGNTATLVAATLAISRSTLYYRKKPRGNRADRTYDEPIVMECGEKLAYGYRRVAWWLQRKKGLLVNRKRVLRVMRERGSLVRSRRLVLLAGKNGDVWRPAPPIKSGSRT